MKKFFTIALLFAGVNIAAAQGTGKVHGNVFSNFNYDLAEEQGAFEISRAYFGYGHTFNDKFSAKLTFDVGSYEVEDIQTTFANTAYLKIAALQWKATDKLTVNFGQVGLKQFKTQEKNWGYRYIAKSSQDTYKMGTSADLGFTADYKLMDMLSVDLTVVNGEGYKKDQADAQMKTGFGLTLKPVDGLTVRAYMDMLNADDVDTVSYPTQSTTALFVGYKADKFRVGAEYNMQAAHKNVEGMDYDITSVYGTYNISDNMGAFVRYDMVSSEENGWSDKNGDYLITGLEYRPAKGISLSANLRSHSHEGEDEAENQVYMNLQFKF